MHEPNISQLTQGNQVMAWVLHYSLFVLESILPQMYLQHYSLLVAAMHLLSSDCISNENLSSVDEMLLRFYEEYGTMYGKCSKCMCIHTVLITSDVLYQGVGGGGGGEGRGGGIS